MLSLELLRIFSVGCTASCCTVGGICKPVEPRAGLGASSGDSSTLMFICWVYMSCDFDTLASPLSLSLFSGLITTFGARMFSILHDTVDDDGMFGILSAIAIALLADTGPFALLVGPVPVWAFFGHDCIGHGQFELWYCGASANVKRLKISNTNEA